MVKHKKKRNKIYSGVDAAITKPIITHISAVNRNKVAQWWFDNKKLAKPILITSAIVIFVILMIFQIVRIATGG